MKAQGVRLVDVALLGPFMVWAGARAVELPPWARVTLVLAGGATIAYNARNFLELRER